MIRSTLFTILIIALLQIKIGSKTLETHALLFLKGSSVEEPLNLIVQGGVKLGQELYKKGKALVGLEEEGL